jgi:F0F1-type ATP synthase assembly protein I
VGDDGGVVWRGIQVAAKVVLGVVVGFVLFEVGAYLGDVTHTGPLVVLIMLAVAILLGLRARRRWVERKLAQQAADEPDAGNPPTKS